jgi:hypothetical protein
MSKDRREIVGIDPAGNTWKIFMETMPTKTNRYKLCFTFNQKEYLLTKLHTNRAADDTWELIQSLNKAKE